MTKNSNYPGHRQRLRQQFVDNPDSLSDIQLLELLLTYAIPRRDVAQQAIDLLQRFGSISDVLSAPIEDLFQCTGIGNSAATMLSLVGQLMFTAGGTTNTTTDSSDDTMSLPQLNLFTDTEEHPETSNLPSPNLPPVPPTMSDIRAYSTDLSKIALEFFPRISTYTDLDEFSIYLEANLPYNSGVTRKRYTNYLLGRYFPSRSLDTPLTKLIVSEPDLDTFKAVLFYETVRAEPAVQFIAEQVTWPALPVGHISRGNLKDLVQKRFGEASDATVKRMTYSLVKLYSTLSVAELRNDFLNFQVRQGTTAAFLYTLVAEYPEPGIYTFEDIEQGPLRYWLLWDREWMRKQLYNLRDMGVVAKVSEIDTYRQFSLQYDQMTTLEMYLHQAQRPGIALREGDASLGGDL